LIRKKKNKKKKKRTGLGSVILGAFEQGLLMHCVAQEAPK